MSATLTAPAAVTYGLDASIARFTVRQYQLMIDAGVFSDDDRFELLEGWVVRKMARNAEHDGPIDLAHAALYQLPPGWWLRIQLGVVLDDSQPEPDLAVVRGTPRSYLKRHPAAADVGLIVEVANTSLLRDKQDKARIYARNGVPVYWVVNLVGGQVEVHTGPSGPADDPAYAACTVYRPGDSVPLELDGQAVRAVAATDLLP